MYYKRARESVASARVPANCIFFARVWGGDRKILALRAIDACLARAATVVTVDADVLKNGWTDGGMAGGTGGWLVGPAMGRDGTDRWTDGSTDGSMDG